MKRVLSLRRTRTHVICAVVALVATLWLSQARADLPVIDFSNLSETTLTAARTLDEVNNQLVQLQHEITMLENEARNLLALPFSIVGPLLTTLSSTTQLIKQAQGIGFQLQQAQSLFTQLYPFSYGGSISGAGMAADALQRWYQSLMAFQTTVGMQAQAATNLNDDANYLSTLISQSQGAVGIVQATQATNQLLALQSRQAIQAQQLQITSDRSAALEVARSVVAESRAREVRSRFVGVGTPYTTQPVNFYGF